MPHQLFTPVSSLGSAIVRSVPGSSIEPILRWSLVHSFFYPFPFSLFFSSSIHSLLSILAAVGYFGFVAWRSFPLLPRYPLHLHFYTLAGEDFCWATTQQFNYFIIFNASILLPLQQLHPHISINNSQPWATTSRPPLSPTPPRSSSASPIAPPTSSSSLSGAVQSTSWP